MELDDEFKPLKTDNDFKQSISTRIDIKRRGPVKYTEKIEQLATEKDDTSNLR